MAATLFLRFLAVLAGVKHAPASANRAGGASSGLGDRAARPEETSTAAEGDGANGRTTMSDTSFRQSVSWLTVPGR